MINNNKKAFERKTVSIDLHNEIKKIKSKSQFDINRAAILLSYNQFLITFINFSLIRLYRLFGKLKKSLNEFNFVRCQFY